MPEKCEIIKMEQGCHDSYDFFEQARREKPREDIIFENISVVTPEKVLEEASVRINSGIITEVEQGFLAGNETRLCGSGKMLLPGIIDLHSDALEKVIEPRPSVMFPITNAILEFDKTLPAYGITTMFQCVSFVYTDFRKRALRNSGTALEILKELLYLRPYLKTRTCTHVRYDVINGEVLPLLDDLAQERKIDLLSFMDHTPGQGQFADESRYIEMMAKMYGQTKEDLQADIRLRKRAREEMEIDGQKTLAETCRSRRIALASHDDDSEAKVEEMAGLGVTIAEFPINEEAMRAANEHGMHAVVGAPNIILGKSHSGNVSARLAVERGLAGIICSDYIPASIFNALFVIRSLELKPFHEIVAMATINPARAVGLDGITGSIEEGKWADLVVASDAAGIPQIERTFVQGYEVYKTI